MMTFWDFYAAHPILGTFVSLLAFVLLLMVLLILSSVEINYQRGPRKPEDGER